MYKVTLDTKNTIAPEPVYLRQGDKTGAVVIDATLMDNGAPVSLDGLTPMFKANTADGQAVIADSTGFNIVNASGGEFTYQVPNVLSSVPGKITTAYFSFSDSSGSESTFDVAFIIKKAVGITKEQADGHIIIIDPIGVNQIDLIKQQAVDFDNGIVNSAAINTALGNAPYSAIGNVRLDMVKEAGVVATNNDTLANKKGITISFNNSFNVYYFEETLEMLVRNNDSSPHDFIIDYVGVKTDGNRVTLCAPLTKFHLPPQDEVEVTTTLPRMDRISSLAYNDFDHMEIMTYTEADASCLMQIKRAKLYNHHYLPDVDNEEKTDTDELLAKDYAHSDTLSSEKVFVESLNKTCQRFYTSTGAGTWSIVAIPMRANVPYTQHIQDGKMDRPLKGSVIFKIPNNVSGINKYVLSLRVYDTSGKAYVHDIKIANGRLNGNVLKYEFNTPSINNIAPNITFDHLELDLAANDMANFDITLIDASLKFNEAETTVIERQNDDLGTNIMKSLNEFDKTLVSTSGAVSCAIDHQDTKNAFKFTKDSSSDRGTISILLPDFSGYDMYGDKQLDLFVTKNTSGSVTIPMQLTLHVADGTSVPIALNPLFIPNTQIHHAQKIKYLQSQADVIPLYATLDFTINDKTAWTFFITDISFKSYAADGTQAMNYLPDKSAKLPQLRLFGDLDQLKSKDDEMVVPCSLVNHEQTVNGYAKVGWQGDSSINWPKKNYKISLFSDPEAKVKLNFKPMPNFYSSNKFNAKADYIDRFHVRNGYGAWLFSQLIQTRQNLPSFFKSMNNFGEIQIMPINILYHNSNMGIYTLQTKKSNDLYGMDKTKPNDIVIQGIINNEGAMWQKDTVTFDPNGEVGDFELISDSDKHQNVQAAINRLAAFINSSTDTDFTANLSQYIDLDSLADLIILNQLTQNFDSIDGKNITYVTHDGLKWYVQAYDMDSTLGTSWQPGSTQDDDIDTIQPARNRLIIRFKNLFKSYIKNRFNEVDNSGVIAPFRMREKFKEMTDSIGEYNFEQDNAVWPNDSYKGKDLNYILWLIVHRYYFTKQWISNL
ncbi:CotH kinase family protein [Lacticaseibacillus paracasei]